MRRYLKSWVIEYSMTDFKENIIECEKVLRDLNEI